jgi:cytoskeleton protein RodZ
MMSNVAQMPSADERNDKRRLHLREVEQDESLLSVGAILRAARIARGKDAGDIATVLKMRRDQLEAIEAGDYARLPGRTYTMGFIRSYARYLELDSDALVQRFKDDEGLAENVAKPVELVFPETNEQKPVPNGSIIVLALVVALVIYAVSYVTMPARKTPTVAKADEQTAVAEESVFAEPVVEAPSSPAPDAASEAPFAEVAPPPAPATTFVAGDAPLPAQTLPAGMQPTSKTNEKLDVAALFQADAPPAIENSPQESPTSPAPTPAHGGARIVLTALEPTYVRIKDPLAGPGRGIYVDRVLKAGESVSAPERSGLLMQTGNAGGLHVAVDGRDAGVMGKRGEVVTRIPVDPAYFLKRVPASQ